MLAVPAERYRTLLEINNAIITHLTHEELFGAVAEALAPVVPFDNLGFTLYEPETDAFRIVAFLGANCPRYLVPGKLIPASASAARREFRKGQTLLYADLETSGELERELLSESDAGRFRSGEVGVASRTKGQYGEGDVEILAEVGKQVALAIINMKSYEEIVSLKATLQAENLYLQESAALMGSFAAAISHELNSPLGALKSALDTSAAIAAREETLPAERRGELRSTQAELRRTILAAADRLHQVVLRMQRFTNLDGDEVRSVDLNSIWRDVADLVGARSRGAVSVELDLHDLPRIAFARSR